MSISLLQPIKPQDRYSFDIKRRTERGILIEIHLADLHFGAIDPKTQYNIYKEQILDEIEKLPKIDIISINGDFWHRKYMSNSDPILYGTLFFAQLRSIAIKKNATVVMIYGTNEHEAGQLQLFYHYLEDPEFDLRIVETIKFEYIKGAKILCIPELYHFDERIYRQFLFESGEYDQCFMHGTFEGSVYKDNAGQSRLFRMTDFINCRGPIVSGHVHVGGCFQQHFYYGGSPLRWKFGEEQEKGFLVVLYNMDNREYFPYLMPVLSFRYDTINIDELMVQDPKDIIQYIDNLKEKDHIDYLRLEFSDEVPSDNIEIIKKYYQTNGKIKLKLNRKKELSSDIIEEEKFQKYDYIFDKNLSPYEILARYINEQEHAVLIDADTIKSFMEEKL